VCCSKVILTVASRTLYGLGWTGIVLSTRIGIICRFRRTDLENYLRAMTSQRIGEEIK